MLTALIVDDEPLARERMRSLLANFPEVVVQGMVGSSSEARLFLETQTPDVIFLDIEMPKESGLNLLKSVADRTKVVFVTAWEKYAVQAFELEALDYLVKPVDPERLTETIVRLRKQLAIHANQTNPVDDESAECEALNAEATAATQRLPTLSLEDTICAPLAGKTTSGMLRVGDICWLESLRNYTRVAIKGTAGVKLFRRRLSDWEQVLPNDQFQRVGRSYIIQLSLIEQIEWSSRYETKVFFSPGAEPLELGRLPAARLKELLGFEL
jgi:two-component system, LytTR family, response regulator